MSKELEDRLKREAIKRRLSGKKSDAYVYGTMRKTGWRPKRENSKLSNNQRADDHDYRF